MSINIEAMRAMDRAIALGLVDDADVQDWPEYQFWLDVKAEYERDRANDWVAEHEGGEE